MLADCLQLKNIMTNIHIKCINKYFKTFNLIGEPNKTNERNNVVYFFMLL
jgi:hypothetical protein